MHGGLLGEHAVQRGVGVGDAALVVDGDDALAEAVQHLLEAVALEDEGVHISGELGADVVERLAQFADFAGIAFAGAGVQIAVGHGHGNVAQSGDGARHGLQQRVGEHHAGGCGGQQRGQQRDENAHHLLRTAPGGQHRDQRAANAAVGHHGNDGECAGLAVRADGAQILIAVQRVGHRQQRGLGQRRFGSGDCADALRVGQPDSTVHGRKQRCGRVQRVRSSGVGQGSGLIEHGFAGRADGEVILKQQQRGQSDGDRHQGDDRRKEQCAPDQHALFFHVLTSNR